MHQIVRLEASPVICQWVLTSHAYTVMSRVPYPPSLWSWCQRIGGIPFQLNGEINGASPWSRKGMDLVSLLWCQQWGRRTASWISQCIESGHTLTDTCTSSPTIWCMSRGNWSKCHYSMAGDITLQKKEDLRVAKEEDDILWALKQNGYSPITFPFCFTSTSTTYTIWKVTRRTEASYNDDGISVKTRSACMWV